MNGKAASRMVGLIELAFCLVVFLYPFSASACRPDIEDQCRLYKGGLDEMSQAVEIWVGLPTSWECDTGVDLCTSSPSTGLDTYLSCYNSTVECWNYGYVPLPNCGHSGYFSFSAAKCLPRSSKPSCRELVGDPVNVTSGMNYQTETDYVSAGPLPIAVRRTYAYNGDKTEWRFSHQSYLYWEDATAVLDRQISYNGTVPVTLADSSDPQIVYIVQSDGGYDVFYYDSVHDSWASQVDSGVSLRAVKNGTDVTQWERRDNATDLTQVFDATGKLVALRNRHGVTVTFSYSGSVSIDQTTPSLTITGDTVISGPGVNLTYHHDASGRVSAVSTPAGTIDYQYVTVTDNYARLESVSYPAEPGQTQRPSKQYLYENTQFPYGLTGIVDETGKRYATWRYNSNGRVEQDYLGQQLEKNDYVYDIDNGQTEVTNHAGKKAIYHYELSGTEQFRITKVEGQASANCAAANQAYEYDYRGRTRYQIDWEGNTTAYDYNDRGLIKGRSSGVNEARPDEEAIIAKEISWHPDFAAPEKIIYTGKPADGLLEGYLTADYTYTAQGRVETITLTDETQIIEPYETNGRTRHWSYAYTYHDAENTLVKTITENGPLDPALQSDGVDDITIKAYDIDGNLISVQNAYGHITQYSNYNYLGQPQSIIDGNQVTTQLTYTVRGWLDTVTVHTSAGLAITDFDYYANGLLQRLTLPDTSYYKFEYNDARHLTAIVNQLGERKEFSPNGLTGEWQSWVIKDSAGQPRFSGHRVFDELGRVMDVIGNSNQQLHRQLSPAGNVDAIEQPGFDVNHDQTVFETLTEAYIYDTQNHPLKITDAETGQTTLTYNAQGLTNSVTPANNLTTSYLYDGFGQLIRRDSPDTGETIYHYDAAGNLERVRGNDLHTTTIAYDALSRPISKSTDVNDMHIEYEYDLNDTPLHDNGIGRLSRVADASGSSDFAYNDLGLKIRDQRTQKAGMHTVSFSTEYRYDPAGALVSMTYPSGSVISFQRNQGQVNRMDALVAGATNVLLASAYQYEPFGLQKGFTLGNGIKLTKSFDLDGRLDVSNWGAPLNRAAAYLYDNFDNISSINLTHMPDASQRFFYDKLHRLDSATGGYGELTYQYDAVGNRQQRQRTQAEEVTTDTYYYPTQPSSNQPEYIDSERGAVTISGRGQGYDGNGSLLFERLFPQGLDRLYNYDEFGRLGGVTDQVTPAQP